MRDPQRIDRILERLRRYWHDHPDLRLGQIVSAAAYDRLKPRELYTLDRAAEGKGFIFVATPEANVFALGDEALEAYLRDMNSRAPA